MGLKEAGLRGSLRNVSAGVSAIPDSGDLLARYDWSDDSTTTSTVPDLTGNGHDLTGTFTSLTVDINGVQAGQFDGTDDSLDVAIAAKAQPNTVFAVTQSNDVGTESRFFDGESAFSSFEYNWPANEMQAFAGATFRGGGTGLSTNPQINTLLFNSTSSIMRVNGSQIASGDVGTNDLNGITVGQRYDIGDRFFNGKIGEILVYPQDKSGIFSDVEQYLAGKWGITL